MVSQKVTIVNRSGLHLKPAAVFAKTASAYDSLVTLTLEESTANAKSILSILGACVKKGDEIEIVCSGPDEEEALKAMVKAVEEGLEEGE